MKNLVFFAVLWTGGVCFTCLDYNSSQVDWYTVYKVPEIPKSRDFKIRGGLAHFYLDVNSPNLTLSDKGMNESGQAVYSTLSAVYNNTITDSMYLMYSDQPPSDSVSGKEKGHTKGVVAFTKTSGFWLVHSVPGFPNKASYIWPKSALRNGQSFLCVSFPYKELGNIATQLVYNEASVYASSVSAAILKDFPLLADVIEGDGPRGKPWTSVKILKSLKGQGFTSFAKSACFGEDLYDGLVAPTLKQNLQVQTWLSGKGGPLDSTCSNQYKVLKITQISLPSKSVIFPTTKDHSKWAVSYSATDSPGQQVSRFNVLENWTCIGDINRMKSQFKRGGGTLCLENSSVWKAYKDLVTGFQKCPPAM